MMLFHTVSYAFYCFRLLLFAIDIRGKIEKVITFFDAVLSIDNGGKRIERNVKIYIRKYLDISKIKMPARFAGIFTR